MNSKSPLALLTYSFLALPLAFGGLPIYIYVPDFYASGLGLSLIVIGNALLVLRLVDAVQDPLIGKLSDTFHHKRGLVVALGFVLLALGVLALFNPLTDKGQAVLFYWFFVSVFICTTGFSVMTINLQASGGLWRASQDERTQIANWREGFGLVGLLIAAILPSLFMLSFSVAETFRFLSVIFLAALSLGLIVFLFWLNRVRLMSVVPPQNQDGFVQAVRGDRWLKHFFLAYLISTFASSIPAVLVLFFVRDYLLAESWTGLFLLLYFLSGASAMPLWRKVAYRYGKISAWWFSMLLAVVSFIWAFLLPQGAVVSFGIICVMSGAALGADLALPAARLADHIEKTNATHHASGYYSLLTFLTKSSFALATGIILSTLGFFGYQPQYENSGGGGNGGDIIFILPLVYALVPCVIKLIAIAWIRFSSCLWTDDET